MFGRTFLAMRRRRALWTLWALFCLATFVWMVTMPTPYLGDAAERCPSLVTMFRLGPEPSLAQKAQLDLAEPASYFRCSRHAAVPWAGLSVVVPMLLAPAGWMVARLQGIVNKRWPQDAPAPLGHRRGDCRGRER